MANLREPDAKNLHDVHHVGYGFSALKIMLKASTWPNFNWFDTFPWLYVPQEKYMKKPS
jgi:hypothetical protein